MLKYLFSFHLFLYLPSLLIAQFQEVTSFQKKLIQEEITGSNVALVYKDGSVVYHHIENSLHRQGKPISENSIFPIWSMSKPITIVAMMQLYEKGLISFEDKVSKYIPEFENLKCKGDNGIYPCENDLTLFHLMTHRSGYAYYDHPHYFTSTIKYDNMEDFARDVANHPVEFEPGSQYLYGINMAILGRIVEVVTGQSFYEYLKIAIFEPLEMDETKFHLTNSDRLRFQPLFINNGSLKGYTDNLDEMSYHIDNRAYFGGEGLVSTMDDYLNFCIMLLNGGTFKGKEIMKKSSIEMMTRAYSEFPGDPFVYGFSFFVLNDPVLDGTNSSKGIYGWSGYHNTHFWIDPEMNMFGLFMTRAREYSDLIGKEFRRTVYQSIH